MVNKTIRLHLQKAHPHGAFALNRYKNTFLIAAAVLLLCGAVFVGGVAGEDTQTHDGITFTAWNTANSLPAEGDYYLNTDVTLSSTWEIKDNKTVNLCLNGHVIQMTGTVSVIKIESGATLNLYDCGTTPHNFTVDTTTGLWTLTPGGDHPLTGGCITGGTGNGGAWGKGGGGVCVNSGSQFTMKGGNIVGNSANDGGGVFVNGGTFTMDGGNIVGNKASNSGGGIYVYNGGQFNLSGGTISSNKANDTGNNYKGGGGVYGLSGTIMMSGGTISDNISNRSGGGIGLNNCTLTLSGGTIKGNTANGSGTDTGGGGVYVIGTTTFNLHGKVVIQNNKGSDGTESNVYLTSEKTITIPAALESGAYIGIANPLTKDENFATGHTDTDTAKTYSVTATDAPCFHPDSGTLVAGVTTQSGGTGAASTLGWGTPVAQRGNTKYISVQDAVNDTAASGEITMIADSTEPTVVVSKTVTLDLNGYVLENNKIAKDNSKSVIRVVSGGNLTVKDDSEATHYFQVSDGSALKTPWVYTPIPAGKTKPDDATAANTIALDKIDSYDGTYGWAKMDDHNAYVYQYVTVTGGCITGGTGTIEPPGGADSNDCHGGGVYVSGTFTLESGNIIGNCALTGSQREARGGCVYVATSGEFNLHGGNIAGNAAKKPQSTSTSGFGGGVFPRGTFTMTGGSIIGNTTDGGAGGGVRHDSSSTFIMSSGNIIGNKSTNGGGVYSPKSFTMSGGNISGNISTGDGGGVRVDTTFEMSGGSIKDNTASGKGGGVSLHDNGVFRVSGLPVIKDNRKSDESVNNVWLNGANKLSLTGNFTGEIYINSPAPSASQETQFGTANTDQTTGKVYEGADHFISDTPANGPHYVGKLDGTTLKWPTSATAYIATLDPRGGSGGSGSVTAISGQAMPSAVMPTKAGDTFTGYFDAVTGGTQYYNANGTSAKSWDKTADTTLYAQWGSEPVPTTYTVTFNGNKPAGASGEVSGVPADITDVEDGSAIPAPDSTPTLTGHTFGGWYKEAACTTKWNFSGETNPDTVTGDTTLYAKWTANTYTITLDPQEGTGGTGSVTATYDAAMPTATMPTKTGYTFAGYFTETSGAGTKYYNADGTSAKNWDKTADTTLYAHWTTNQYEITVDSAIQHGSVTWAVVQSNASAPYDTTIQITATAATGYQLKAGSIKVYKTGEPATEVTVTNNQFTVPAFGVTITAKFEPNTYTITYNLDGGTAGDKQPVSGTYDSVFEVSAPTKEGHTFTGWTLAGTNPDYTTAKYGKSGDPVDTAIAADTKCIGTDASSSVWFKNLSTTANGSVTLTATWSTNDYDITVDPAIQHGTVTWAEVPSNSQYGKTIQITAEPATGYQLKTDSLIVYKTGEQATKVTVTNNQFTMPAYGVTITAVFELKKYTITFDSAGGSAVPSITQDYGTAITAPADPTKIGCIFAGWTPAVPATMPAADITCVAQWTVVSYTAKVDDYTYGGTVPTPKVIPEGPADVSFFYIREGQAYSWDTLKPTTLDAGSYYVRAVDNTGAVKIKDSSFTVNKAEQVKPDISVEAVADGIKTTITNYMSGYTYLYRLDAKNWELVPAGSSSFTIPGLDAETLYTVAVKINAKGNYKESISDSKTVTTLGTFSVSYNANGGVGTIEPQTATMGESITVASSNAISRNGYTFTVWTTNPDGTGDSFTAGVDPIDYGAVLYAQWEAQTYTISFDAHGGDVTPLSKTVRYGEPYSLPTATHQGNQTFSGWAVSKNGSVMYAGGQQVKDLGDITLHAVWVNKTFGLTVKVQKEDGSLVDGATVTLKLGSAEFRRPVSSSSEGLASFSDVPEGNYTLVAEKDGRTVTIAVTVDADQSAEITFPASDVNSIVDVKEGTPAVIVDGAADLAANSAQNGKSVTVTVTVETKTEGAPASGNPDDQETQIEIKQIKNKVKEEAPAGSTTEYLGIDIEKLVQESGKADEKSKISSTANVLEFLIPYDFSGKNSVILYRCHEGSVVKLKKINTRMDDTEKRIDGTYYPDTANGIIYLYSSLFSTYGVNYSTSDSPTPSQSTPSGSSTWIQEPVPAADGKITSTDVTAVYAGIVFIPATTVELRQIEAVNPAYAELISASLKAAENDGVPLTNSKGAKVIIIAPDEIPGIQKETFAQVIDVESADGSKVTSVPFKVRLSDLTAKSLTTDDVTLYHYLEEYGLWIPLETGLVSTDDVYAYYEAATDGASPFGVLLKKIDAPEVQPVPSKTPAGKSPVPFMGILAGLGCAAVVFAVRMRR